MKKNRLGSAEVGSCICYGLMALLQVGWLAVLLTAQLVPPVWVTLMVYCVGRWRCSYWDRRCGWCSCGGTDSRWAGPWCWAWRWPPSGCGRC